MRVVNQLMVLAVVTALAGCAGGRDSATVRFSSPSGRIGIAIKMVADVKADDPLNEEQVAFLRYSITYSDSLGQPLATAVYNDVYGVDREPFDLADLARWMVWSPYEDFVILPAEGWMTAPGTVGTLAVNLNVHHRWTSTLIAIDDRIWVDSLRIIGNDMSDCEYSVVMFDGRTGETKPIKSAASPIGYSIVRVEERALHIQSRPDNCSSEEQRAAFVPECWIFSFELFSLTSEPCLSSTH